ncbi:hypothetical protein MY04_2008 [Flammeovirga sp. MY04]|uniref:hypothetical protein n=1 Tax=Flammeovirga sp. MY04 TaxID=1191459 RepID=UPI0008060CA3|nr:hypothetical protein [Flammeovirga sp. MY04]ANQ49382.1 hypothetical protein MY04_2008 [Flammeovirga sp. MY04]
MKNKILNTISIALLIAVNLSDFWVQLPGAGDFVFSLILVFIFLILAFFALIWTFRLLLDKFKDRKDNITAGLMYFTLIICFLFPTGVLSLFQESRIPSLYASYEGVANCRTSLKFFDDNSFTYRNACFGIDQCNGTYQIINDTINLTYNGRFKCDNCFQFAIYNKDSNSYNGGDLYLFRSMNDTIPKKLWVNKIDRNVIKL